MEEQRTLAARWGKLTKDQRFPRLRRWALRLVALTLGVAVFAAGCENVLERRARARLTQGSTFIDVGEANIRYELRGPSGNGATVVFLSGIGGSIEQMVHVQRRVAERTQTLSFDRGGYGFATGSNAHNAAEMAAELGALLESLKVSGKVVLVAFSSSASIARLFAAQNPDITQGLYLIEPYLPEVEARVPWRKSQRRQFVRWIVHDLSMSTFGLLRARNRLRNYAGPPDLVEQRAEEILQSRPHFWAMAHEWYALPVTAELAKNAKVGSEPIVIMFTKQHGTAEDEAVEKTFADFVQRSPKGKLVSMGNYDHSKLLTPGPALDLIVQGILELALQPAP